MLLDFFAGFTAAELIVMLAGAIYSIVQVFIPGISPIEWFKSWTGWEGIKVKIMVQAFFFLMSILAMWLTGEIKEVGFTLASLMTYFGVWYGWSQLAWETLKAAPQLRIGGGG